MKNDSVNKMEKSCVNCQFCGPAIYGTQIICAHPSWKKLEDHGEEIDISEKTFDPDFADFCEDFLLAQ